MIAAIIQARMSSKRLPRKVLLPLGDTTVLGSTVRQVRKSKLVERTIVATSTESEDDAIASHCEELSVECFRGSLDDVLDRYHACAKHVGADRIVRVTADCPVIDPEVIDLVVREFGFGQWDYVSNGFMESTFPAGMDVEVASFQALDRAWREATRHSDREHVMTYFWTNPRKFRIREVRSSENLSDVRVTLDEADDYEVIQRVTADVQPLSLKGIVEYLRSHPDISALNKRFVRNEGLRQSRAADTL